MTALAIETRLGRLSGSFSALGLMRMPWKENDAEAPSASAWASDRAVRLESLKAELKAVAMSASHDDWDGEGARALREDSLDRAEKLLELLPASMPDPEMSVSGLGSLTLDWDDGPEWQLSLALTERDTISYAGYFRGARSHGEFPFYPERLPEEIAIAIRRWTNPRRGGL